MGEEEECKPMFQKDGMVGSGSPTTDVPKGWYGRVGFPHT